MRADDVGHEAGRQNFDVDRPVVDLERDLRAMGRHCLDVRGRQATPDAGNEPDRGTPRRCATSDGGRARRHDDLRLVHCKCFDQYDAGDAGGRSGSPGVDRFVVDVVALESTDERCRRVIDIERKDSDVAASSQAMADHAGVADGDDGRLVGQRCCEFGGRAVGTHLIGQLPDGFEGLSRRRNVRTQPPQRAGEGVTLDDPATGDDEPGGVEVQRAERVCRLLHERRRIDAVGPCDVAEMFDRVHDATVGHGACERTPVHRVRSAILPPWPIPT